MSAVPLGLHCYFPAAAGGSWSFGTKILVPIVTVALAGIGLAGSGLYWAANRSDAVSVERQVRTTRHAIVTSIDDLALQQETVAIWDESAAELAKRYPDPVWLRDNVSLWLHNIFAHDEVFILDGSDRPVQVMSGGRIVALARFDQVARDLKPMVDAVRGRSEGPNSRHDRNPGRPLASDATVLTTPRTTHDSGLSLVGGRPAAASAMLIQESTPGYARPRGAWPVLISVRYIDGSFLADLADRILIEAPRFSSTGSQDEGEHEVALVTERGEQIGYLVWRPELPGTVLLRVLGPVTALAVLLTLLALGLLARSLRRSTQELEASRAQAQHLAFHDVLTGLPNRALYNDRLDHALAQARRGCKVAVLALDLDRFKHVNDTLGHHAGDALIREFARRLDDVVRDGDTVARLGGDEFAIALTSHQATDVEAVCQRILDAVRQPFDLFGSNAFVGVSIGVVHAPSDGLDRIELMRKADIALYRAKGEGRDCYRIFTAAMDDTVRLRGTIEDELRTALETGDGLQVHYQPQVAGGSRSVVGLEALVRWEHPKRGLIAPDQFISVAEETGLICQLGEWVLREACSTACRYPELFMAVNLSPVQFRTTGFADKVVDIVRTSGADPRRIELEVTESVLLDDDEPVRTALKTLRSAGLRIALDDFGTGYSSLSYLKRFEVDKIKIDKSFIQHLGQTADSAAIVTAVVTLGHAMGLAVTAEGVETEEQKQFLAAAGCTTMQGYLFSRALPEKQLASVLPDHGRNILVA